MERRIVLTPRARADLAEIWAYTAREWSPGQAERYLGGLRTIFALLAASPEIARLRSEITPPVRLHPYRSHLIIFQHDAAVLDVLRVVHARSDWLDLLAK